MKATDDPQWYALRVQVQKEYVVASMLERRGLWAYVPTASAWRRRTRYVKSSAEYAHPEMPGCIFARFPGEPAWFEVLKNHLIIGPLGRNGSPWQFRVAELFDYFARVPNGTLVMDKGEQLVSVAGRLLRAPRTQTRFISKRAKEAVVEPTRFEREVLGPLAMPARGALMMAA